MTATLEAPVAFAPPDDTILPVRRGSDFARTWGAHCVSNFGDHFTMVALPLAAFARTRSPLVVGIVGAMEAVTVLLLGLAAGAVGDRVRRRPLLVTTDLLRGAVLAVLAFAVIADGYPVAFLYVAAFLLGALRVVHDAAEAALVPILVDERDVLRANGRINASDSTATAVGPAMAGGLVALGGPALAFAADAATFAVSGLTMRSVRRIDGHDAPRAAGLPAPRLRTEIAEGCRALWLDRVTMRALVVVGAMNVVAIGAEGQFIPYADEVLGVGAAGIGAYFALGGAVAVLTSMLAGRSSAVRGDRLLIGVAVFAAGFLLAGVAPSHLTAAVAFVCAGFGSALTTTHWYSLRHKRFPVHLIGRVTTVTRMAIMALVPVAYVAGGWLARHSGPEALFVAVAGIGLAATAWGTAVGLGRVRVD